MVIVPGPKIAAPEPAVRLFVTAMPLALPVLADVSSSRYGAADPSLMTDARRSPPAALTASARPCSVLFELVMVTVVAVPLPTWRVSVPSLMAAFGSENPADATWAAFASELTVREYTPGTAAVPAATVTALSSDVVAVRPSNAPPPDRASAFVLDWRSNSLPWRAANVVCLVTISDCCDLKRSIRFWLIVVNPSTSLAVSMPVASPVKFSPFELTPLTATVHL